MPFIELIIAFMILTVGIFDLILKLWIPGLVPVKADLVMIGGGFVLIGIASYDALKFLGGWK